MSADPSATENPPDLDTAIALLPQRNGNTNLVVPRKDGTPRRARRSAPKGDYLSPRVRRAIVEMVMNGRTRPQAAALAGLKDTSLQVAFQMNKVRLFYTQCLEVLRTGARAEGLRTIIDLNSNAKSENVRLSAAKYLDSEGSSDKPGVQVNVQVNNAPGYVIDVGKGSDEAQRIAHLAGSTSTVLDNID